MSRRCRPPPPPPPGRHPARRSDPPPRRRAADRRPARSARCTACCPWRGWSIAATKSRRRAVLHLHLRARARGFVGNIARPVRLPRRHVLALDAQQALYAGVGALLSAVVSGAGRLRAGQVPLSPAGARCSTCCWPGVLVPGDHPGDPAVPAAGQGGHGRHLLVGAAAQHRQPVRHLSGPHLRGGGGPGRAARGGPDRRRRRVAGIFRSIALPMMVPGLVTVFLFQFVAIWNNFLLPFIMLGDDRKFPLTRRACTRLLNQGAHQPALYTLVITGALLSIVPLIALFLVPAALLADRPALRRGQGVSQRRRPCKDRSRDDRSEDAGDRPTIHDVARGGRGLPGHRLPRPQRWPRRQPDRRWTAVDAGHPAAPGTWSTSTPAAWSPSAPTRSPSCSPSRRSGSSRTPTSACCCAAARGAGRARHRAGADDRRHRRRAPPDRPVHDLRPRRRGPAGLHPQRRPAGGRCSRAARCRSWPAASRSATSGAWRTWPPTTGRAPGEMVSTCPHRPPADRHHHRPAGHPRRLERCRLPGGAHRARPDPPTQRWWPAATTAGPAARRR